MVLPIVLPTSIFLNSIPFLLSLFSSLPPSLPSLSVVLLWKIRLGSFLYLSFLHLLSKEVVHIIISIAYGLKVVSFPHFLSCFNLPSTVLQFPLLSLFSVSLSPVLAPPLGLGHCHRAPLIVLKHTRY